MAHEIKELDRVMLGSRVPAWHGLGTVIDGQPQTAEAIRLSGLDWPVTMIPAYWSHPSMTMGIEMYQESTIARFIARGDLPDSDPRRILGHCGMNYQPIQNTEAFGIGDALMGDGGMRWETAGSLHNGRIVWMLGAMPQEIRVKDDRIKTYLLISNPHTGAKTLDIQFTGVRVVCSNTLGQAKSEKNTGRARIHHTGKIGDQVKDARRILSLAETYWAHAADTFEKMAEAKVDDRFVRAYLSAIFPMPTDPERTLATQNVTAIHDTVGRLFHGEQAGAGMEATRGTAWGLYNATTEYLNRRNVRTPKRLNAAESRFERMMYGRDQDTSEMALDLICRQTGITNAYATPEMATVSN